MDAKKMRKAVSDLVNTSVEDMRSSLACAEANGTYSFNSAVLQMAYEVVSKRGEKTKARIIQRYIKKAIKKERTA
jgi:hypothetical protein